MVNTQAIHQLLDTFRNLAAAGLGGTLGAIPGSYGKRWIIRRWARRG